MNRTIEKDLQNCENCYFATEHKDGLGTDWWTCDYNPPMPIGPDEDFVFDKEVLDYVAIRQIVVPSFHWCGRWEPNEEWASESQETI